jgi:PEP-CTERM motif
MSISPRSCRSVLLAVGLFAATPTARAETITLDFSEPGVGPFDPNFFADRGVVFQPGLSVGSILGDEALVSSAFFGEPPEFSQSISGSFLTDDVGFISIAVAPSSQYLSNFHIAALDQNTFIIDAIGVTLNSLSSTGLRYITVDLALPEPASSFLLFNQLVCGGGLCFGRFPEFGLGEMTIGPAPERPPVVPEPSALGLLAVGLATAGVLRRVWK